MTLPYREGPPVLFMVIMLYALAKQMTIISVITV